MRFKPGLNRRLGNSLSALHQKGLVQQAFTKTSAHARFIQTLHPQPLGAILVAEVKLLAPELQLRRQRLRNIGLKAGFQTHSTKLRILRNPDPGRLQRGIMITKSQGRPGRLKELTLAKLPEHREQGGPGQKQDQQDENLLHGLEATASVMRLRRSS
jgi:hypothetical protein